MSRLCPIGRYPKIKQARCDLCMFASIENSIKFIDSKANITQTSFEAEYIKLYNNEQPHFGVLKETLDSSFENLNLDYDIESWQDVNSMREYIDSKIQQNLPVIVSMRLPDRIHMWNIVAIDNERIQYFDTDPNADSGLITCSLEEFEGHFQPGRQTFVVHP